VGSDSATGSSAAVLADDVPLVHTAQLVPLDDAGRIAAPGDAQAQLERLLAQLEAILHEAGSDADHLVKLNLYVRSEEIGDVVWTTLAKKFDGESRPAASIVVTALPNPQALVALDAVAAASKSPDSVGLLPSAAVLPRGARLYVSGQAEPGTLVEATRKTLASLSATLKHCGRGDGDIVQLKCFLQPMSSANTVRDEIARHFGAARTPPVVFVEWQSGAPIEIELVAWGGPAKADAAQPLEFITPPGMKASPLFSRVARIQRGGTIFFSDLFGPPPTAFEQLRHLLGMTGSDLTHLAKATYYVSDDEVSRQHNEVRPKFYDPERPPAASKALVAGIGRAGSRYAMDMIAVASSRGTPATGPEHGNAISAEESAAGWISLFDGATTLGWNGARAEEGLLRGGVTTTRFGPCQVRGRFAGRGTVFISGQEFAVSADKPLEIERTRVRGPIGLGPGVAIRSLAVRPLGMQELFNHRDLSGWKPIGRTGVAEMAEPFWRVEGGFLRVVGGPAALEHDGPLQADCVIQLDVRTRAVHSNGGLFFRAVPGQFMNGYEAQLHNRCRDDDPARTFRYATGGLDDRQDALRLVSRDFETFRMTVIADGPHIATWVNGHQTADWTDERQPHGNPREGRKTEAGAIQLQAHDPATDYEVQNILAASWD
jgi:enamine deaminase RidA (YjgF/YER057c/UK114 family)